MTAAEEERSRGEIRRLRGGSDRRAAHGAADRRTAGTVEPHRVTVRFRAERNRSRPRNVLNRNLGERRGDDATGTRQSADARRQ